MPNKYKEIKKHLNRAYKYTKIKETLEREYKQRQKEVDNINISYNEIKINNTNSKVENKALGLVSLKKYIELYSLKLEKTKKEISCVIDKLEDDTLKTLLRLRYLEFRKWENISYILNYSERHTRRLFNRALAELIKIYSK